MDTASDPKLLLLFDLDETLIFATEKRLPREPDFVVGPYFVYCRPHLEWFLAECARVFRVAVWSSSGGDYAEAVVRAIFPADAQPLFVWSRERCVQRFDAERHETYFVKDLKKLKCRGFDLDRLLFVEDTPRKLERNYGNAVYVASYAGAADDAELKRLGPYLASLSSLPNVRDVEKRGWRS